MVIITHTDTADVIWQGGACQETPQKALLDAYNKTTDSAREM